MKTYIDYCPSAPVSINAELITVPSGPPYVVETEHNWIVNDSSIEIWENNDKSGTHLVEEAYDGSVSGSGKFQVDYLGASEGDAKYCNKIFFHADQGGLSFYVWYKTEGDVFGASDANSKALKDSDAVAGNLAEFDANGNPVDSGLSKPNVSDAVSKKHDQNTDQYLDFGGANQVSALQAKTAYTNNHTHSNKTLLDTYTQSETDLADAVSKKHTQDTDQYLDYGGSNQVAVADVKDAVTKKHTQNTDTGTTSQTFQLQTGSSGAKLKNNSGVIEIRNSADSAYANIRPNNIYPLGSTTTPLFTTADVVYFVNPSTGNDNNNGSSGSPFKTIAKAISLIPQIVNHNVTINLADGNYSEGITLAGYVGNGAIIIVGNLTTPTNVVFSSYFYVFRSTCLIFLQGMQTTYTGDDSIYIYQNPGTVQLNKLVATNSTADYAALYVSSSPSVYILSSTLSNHKYGIYATNTSRVFSNLNSGSGNGTGLLAGGATIMKSSTQPGGIIAEGTGEGGVIR